MDWSKFMSREFLVTVIGNLILCVLMKLQLISPDAGAGLVTALGGSYVLGRSGQKMAGAQ